MEEPINSLDEFKKADQPTRDYFLYSAVRDIPQIKDLKKIFASKMTEKLVIGFVIVLLLGFATAVVNAFIIK